MRKIYLAFLASILTLAASAQWSYVGSPAFTGGFTTISIPEMDMNSGGDILVGYETGNFDPRELSCALYEGGSWSQLPVVGTFDQVSRIDVEIHNTEYYYSFARVRSGNMYVFVFKYNGSAWAKLGDSLLLGNAGSGGYYDFLVSNAGVPTVVGVVTQVFQGDKNVAQFTGGQWNITTTLTGTPGAVFTEHSAAFDSQDKLYTVAQAFTYVPFKQFSLVYKIEGVNATIAGDTLFNGSVINTTVDVDGSDVPYVCYYGALTQKTYAYKLNGSGWSLVGDTTQSLGIKYNGDVNDGGKVVFNTLSAAKLNLFYYEAGSIYKIEDITANGVVASIADLSTPASSSNVYALINEINGSAQQTLSVMKHTVTGSLYVGIEKVTAVTEQLNIYPNPSNGNFTIPAAKGNTVKIYNVNGQLVYNAVKYGTDNGIAETLTNAGIYYVQVIDETGNTRNGKIIVQ